METNHSEEVESRNRFRFGENWKGFSRVIDSSRIRDAERSLVDFLEIEDLRGKTFVDVGCGSGLFSLAARNIGATVMSFDYDPASVECTKGLRERKGTERGWSIRTGSILDKDFVKGLGKYDVAMSWGVAHHTGDMWKALKNTASLVGDNGRVYIAIYNYQPLMTKYWKFVKRMYNKSRFARPFIYVAHVLYPTLPSIVVCLVKKKRYPRGMNRWNDLRDWLGGYPFETASPDEVIEFLRRHGFVLEKIRTVGGRHGCNEYLFRKTL